ncbi:MAG: KH domain-containing protein [Candidatus Micrarchaeota archaeon]
MKRIVMPGDRLSEKEVDVPNTYIENGSTYAEVVGVMDEEERYTPLEVKYIAGIEDVVVGVVVGSRSVGYSVDLKVGYPGFIPSRDLRARLEIGDMIVGKVKNISDSGDIDLCNIRKLPNGKLVTFPTAKIPRLIGRKSSMLTLIRDAVGGEIVVGNNGYVWISEQSDIPRFMKAVELIIEKAHTSGLTDQIAELLKRR